MDFPENLIYTKDHEWVKVENGEAYIGITDFAQSELGDIVFVEVESVGQSLEQGDVFGTVEAVKTVADLYMPADGEVLEFNEALEDAPENVNEDPYEKGWMVKISVENKGQLDDLLDADDYKNVINEE